MKKPSKHKPLNKGREMKEKESHKSIFTLTELADYLGVTRQAISLYKKNNPKRFELMLLGFAAKKLDISYDDLKELNKLKGYIVADNKRNDYRYFYNLQELADFLGVALNTVKTAYKKSEKTSKRDELIRIGFAVYKLNVDFSDLLEYKDYEKVKEEIANKLKY